MRLAKPKTKPMRKDEYVCRALGLYNSSNSISPAVQKRMRDRVRASFNSLYGEDEMYENAKGKFFKGVGDALKKGGKAIAKAAKKVGDAAKEVGKVAAKAGLVVPRQAARGLIELNFRGIASKMHNLKAEAFDKLKKNWKNVGGEGQYLEKSIEIGRKRKPLACGKKCKAKAGQKGFDGEIYYNFEPATTASLIASGLGVVTSITSGLLERKNAKDQAEFDAISQQVADEENKENATPPTAEDKKAIEDAAKAAKEADPRTQIMNNPNLSEEEKVVAIDELNKVLGDSSQGAGGMNTKTILLVVGGLAAIGLAYYFFSKRGKGGASA